jgi:hypothetical protein
LEDVEFKMLHLTLGYQMLILGWVYHKTCFIKHMKQI